MFSQLLANLPLILCAAAVIVPRWHLRRLKSEEHFARDYLLAMVLGPWVMHLLLSLVFGFELRSMWGAPLWTFLGLLLLLTFELRLVPRHFWGAVAMCGIATVIMLVACLIQTYLAPFLRGAPSRIHFPGQLLAERVQEVWLENYDRPLHIVAGDWWLAGNVCFYSPSVNEVYGSSEPGTINLPHELSPWTSDEELRVEGGVILWDATKHGDRLSPSLRRRFPTARTVVPLELPYQTLAQIPPARIGMALVPPEEDGLPTNDDLARATE